MAGGRFFIVCFLGLVSFLAGCLGSSEDFVMQLSEMIKAEQITENVPFRGIGRWQKVEGVYMNYMMINFNGAPDQCEARHKWKVPDMNSFIAPYTSLQMFDAHIFGKAPMISKSQIDRTVDMYGKYHDKNRPGASAITFYPQSYNETTGVWYIDPNNIINAFWAFEKIFDIEDVFMGPAPLPPGFEVAFGAPGMVERSRCPADFDSSSVHLNFGSMLYELRDWFPEAWQMWSDDNPNILSVFEYAKHYAYRPFSDDRDRNSIDPRTYYVIRGFLDEAKREGRDVALIPTWIDGIDDFRTQYYLGTIMPFGINNVDLAVQANLISGMYLAFSTGLVDTDVLFGDEDLQLIVSSMTSLMVYGLERNLTKRPDLALTYYPSSLQFYWYVSRGLMHMEKDRQKGPLVAPVFEKYYQDLKAVMTTTSTDIILSSQQVDDCGRIYYDDFMGTADFTKNNTPINRAEDRIFTTAMAADSLIFIWSEYDHSQQKIRWRESVPNAVKDTVRGCVEWLKNNTLSGEYLPWNAFFGIDFKNRENVGYFYPANRFEFLNGTEITEFDSLPIEPTIYAMEGYVEPEEYERLLKMDWFGMATPRTFQGYNEGQGATNLWSADVLTYGGVLMAVAMSEQLDN